MSYDLRKKNLLELFKIDFLEKIEDGKEEHDAFARVATQWLGYSDIEADQFLLYKDRGIDFYIASPSLFEVFQVKTHKTKASGDFDLSSFDKEGVNDLDRAHNLILGSQSAKPDSPQLQFFLEKWHVALNSAKAARDATEGKIKKENSIIVNLTLVLIGEGLTTEAQDEFNILLKNLEKPKKIEGIDVYFRPILMNIDDILRNRWREDNLEWRDKNGIKREEIELAPDRIGNNCFISAEGNAVFYCRALDLIMAFEDLGYQIFEPNVRAKIVKSKVNEAIESSIASQSQRKIFKFLNNGVTITCDGFKKPSNNKPKFKVTRPGIINGLQTVTSAYEAYSDLKDNPQQKADFENNCFVLVRLLDKNKVHDVEKIILATNTQNEMKPRNLRSNSIEQIDLEKMFALFGWFYERKQGAWNAFVSNPKQWRTLPNKTKENFHARGAVRKYLKIDNEELAQCWTAFIGFSNEAAHNKKELFEDKSEWYKLIFLSRVSNHAIAYGFDAEAAYQYSQKPSASDPQLLLAAYLARELAKACSLSPKENRNRAIERNKISSSDAAIITQALAADKEYLMEQAVAGMSLVFVDFVGYLLFKALSADVHTKGRALLSTGIWKKLYEGYEPKQLADGVRKVEFDEKDLLAISWHAFRHCIEDMLSGAWGELYKISRTRSRFFHSIDTRKRLYSTLDNLDDYMKRTILTRNWAAGIPERAGLIGYIKSTIEKK
jgi:hypothetical protein